jgi:hypothetical protein
MFLSRTTCLIRTSSFRDALDIVGETSRHSLRGFERKSPQRIGRLRHMRDSGAVPANVGSALAATSVPRGFRNAARSQMNCLWQTWERLSRGARTVLTGESPISDGGAWTRLLTSDGLTGSNPPLNEPLAADSISQPEAEHGEVIKRCGCFPTTLAFLCSLPSDR